MFCGEGRNLRAELWRGVRAGAWLVARGRAPGWGEVDWPAFISALIEVGYRGNIDIEHEDDVLAFSELRDFTADMESSIVMALRA